MMWQIWKRKRGTNEKWFYSGCEEVGAFYNEKDVAEQECSKMNLVKQKWRYKVVVFSE